jgi:(S)-citramalyl-CoA lyase
MNPKSRKSVRSLKSWLFTPGTKADHFEKAAEVRADALIIDLEDAVAPSAKQEARCAALHYLEGLGSDRSLPCALRINAPITRVGLDDLQSLLNSSAEPDFIVLPKCESAGEIRFVSTLLREAGKSTEVIALIETAKAVAALATITGADVKPAALLFGAADMAADLGAEAAWEPMLWVRSRIVEMAACGGIAAIDSPYFEIADAEGLQQETKRSASLGFHGKCAIHPSQISTINAVLTPSEQQIAVARQVLVVNRKGVGSVDHQMVDEAVARNARLFLERAGITAEN